MGLFGKKKKRSERTAGVDTVGKTQQQIESGQALKTAAAGGVGGGAAPFQKAIVADIITDPESVIELLDEATEEKDGPLTGKLKNEEVVRAAPRGSL